MKMDLEQQVYECIEEARKGRDLWLNILEKYELGDKDYIILMPSLNVEYNYYTLLHLDEFFEKVKAEKIIILTYDVRVQYVAKLFSNNIYDVCYFSREDAEALMRFYCLYMFTDKLIIASLEEPEGRNGRKLIGKKGITLEEIICIGIYGLRGLKKVTPPDYDGNDENIMKFLSLENY